MPRRLRGDAELGIGSKSTPWYSCYHRYHHRSGRVIAKFTERSVNRHYPPLENYSEIVRSRERNSIRNSPFVDTFIFNGSYSRRTSSRSKKHRDCPFDQIVQLSSTLSSLQIRKISLNTNLSSKFYIRHLAVFLLPDETAGKSRIRDEEDRGGSSSEPRPPAGRAINKAGGKSSAEGDKTGERGIGF